MLLVLVFKIQLTFMKEDFAPWQTITPFAIFLSQ